MSLSRPAWAGVLIVAVFSVALYAIAAPLQAQPKTQPKQKAKPKGEAEELLKTPPRPKKAELPPSKLPLMVTKGAAVARRLRVSAWTDPLEFMTIDKHGNLRPGMTADPHFFNPNALKNEVFAGQPGGFRVIDDISLLQTIIDDVSLQAARRMADKILERRFRGRWRVTTRCSRSPQTAGSCSSGAGSRRLQVSRAATWRRSICARAP